MRVKSGKDHRARSQTFVQSPSPALPPKFPRKNMPPPLLTLYTTSWGFFFLCWEREGEEVSMGEKGIQARRAEVPSLPPFPTAWAPPQPACPRAPAVLLGRPGPHGLLLPPAHRQALTPKLSSALKTPPRASSCSLSHRVWSLQLQRQSCQEPGISIATFIL